MNRIDLVPYLPEEVVMPQKARPSRKAELVAALLESLATLAVAGGVILFLVAFLSTL